MADLPISLIKVARPIHWVKNLSVFAALLFTGYLYHKFPFFTVFWAFICFCLITSTAYIINDILDIKADRVHPIKKNRPIASGKLPVSIALIEAVVLAFLAIILAQSLGNLFSYLVWTYLILQVLYSVKLKNIPIVDILIIAFGFILRVYAGAVVINAHLSVWFLLCVISIALFLASGKRRAELNIKTTTFGATRQSLNNYNKGLLNSYVTMFGNAAWVSWALFTFFEGPKASLPIWLVLAELSKTTTIGKLLMITIPVVIFGIMRYEYLIFGDKSEAPEKVLLTDKALTITVAAWIGLVVWVFYGGVSI
ncbi:decaprenyl-phosphate phosphoribosyltransferase [Candidatus Woesebacteria bacterium CG07_land_8_20_14_0_80_44_9]|uniref:Decaprenyl-phosphate phosphoribosyltransferase n=2 Tax=Candidatus Woeseibacteriota TaxID=1752722 RepID=A0A2H0BHE1_9BACT|nr:MAG: decaprenyl-phosphate phosphoribosyltransferase [Candidatus Woesebacteria bacterium CG22_combo_CG10-13_8_21_14_all_45_10]PIU28794.1 MAG: decaprenyl-phosphate phosphoribosyltransferase [Candidatus Woesebacteria bacterium CG07_land_8_20_14_0_80_44_9]